MKKIVTLLAIGALGSLNAETFSGVVPNPGTFNIPDNSPETGLNISYAASGLVGDLSAVELDLDLTHSWTGDLNVILISPDGDEHEIMWRTGSATGTGAGDSSDLGGVYNFTDDINADNFWETAVALVGGTIPPGDYRTSGVGSATPTVIRDSFSSVGDPNGMWQVVITDNAGGDTGSVTASNLTLITDQQTIPGTGTGSIPDNSPDCNAGAGCLEIEFDVSNVFDPIVAIELDMEMTHSWVGDLNIILAAPDTTSHVIMWRTGSTTGTSSGDSSDLGGVYNFTDDVNADNFWETAVALVGGTIPAGDYRTSSVGSPDVTNITSAFQSVANPNGTWVLTVTDNASGDTGGISAANLFIMTANDIIFRDGFE